MKTTFFTILIVILSFSVVSQTEIDEDRKIVAPIELPDDFYVVKMDHLDEVSHMVTACRINSRGYHLYYVKETGADQYEVLELDELWKDIERHIGKYCKVDDIIYRIRTRSKGKDNQLFLDQLQGNKFVEAETPFYSLSGKSIGNFMYRLADKIYFVHANEESKYPKNWKYEDKMYAFNVLQFDLPKFDNPLFHEAALSRAEILDYELASIGTYNESLFVTTLLKPNQAKEITLKCTEFVEDEVKETTKAIQLDFDIYAIHTATFVDNGLYALIMDPDGGLHGVFLEIQNADFELVGLGDLSASEVFKEYATKASGEPMVGISKVVMDKQIWFSFAIEEGRSFYVFNTFGYYTTGEFQEVFIPHDCIISKLEDGHVEWITNIASGRIVVNALQEIGLADRVSDLIPKIEFTPDEIILQDIETTENLNKEGEFERSVAGKLVAKLVDMRVILNKEDGTFQREITVRE